MAAKPPKRTKPRNSKPAVLLTPQAFVAAAVAPAEAPALTLPRPNGLWSAAALLSSFCLPQVGLILGLLYAAQADRKARNFGRWCLVLAAVGAIVAAVTGAVRNALGSGEWLVQPYN